MSPYLGDSYREQTGATLDDELRLAHLALDSTHEGVIIHRLDGTLVMFNEAAATNLGFTAGEFATLPPFGWTPPRPVAELEHLLNLIMQPGGHTFVSSRVMPDGCEIAQEVHSRFVETTDGGYVISVSHDATDKVRAEKILRELAFHDALTGLANRAAFDERLETALASARRHGDLVGVIFIDLDDFKDVNDRFGHDAGDGVLVALARRLEEAVRVEDTVARLGGDEFVVIVPRLDAPEDLGRVASKLRDAIAQPVSLTSGTFSVTAATGISLFDPAIDDARSLLVRADVAMYESKRRARQER